MPGPRLGRQPLPSTEVLHLLQPRALFTRRLGAGEIVDLDLLISFNFKHNRNTLQIDHL